MRLITLMILIALTAVPALAHEVQPLPQKESCDAAKWLGSLVNATSPHKDGYNALRVLQGDAANECEKHQAGTIDWAEVDRVMDAAVEKASSASITTMPDWLRKLHQSKAVTKCE